MVEAMSEHDHSCGVVLDLPWLDSRLVITLFFSGLGRIIGKGGGVGLALQMLKGVAALRNRIGFFFGFRTL